MTDLPEGHRLRWLCRRGMLELDTWLGRFLDQRYSDLPPDQQVAFARLLGQDDMVLFDWLTGGVEPPRDFRALVEAIKSIQQSQR